MTKRLPTCFRLASDIATRQQGWVSSNTMQGQVHSAALIAGVFAETFHDEAVAKIPCFE
jgi:hypothetical protein